MAACAVEGAAPVATLNSLRRNLVHVAVSIPHVAFAAMAISQLIRTGCEDGWLDDFVIELRCVILFNKPEKFAGVADAGAFEGIGPGHAVEGQIHIAS